MFKHRGNKRSGSITVLGLLLVLWLGFPVHAEEGEQGIFKPDLLSFSLALSGQNATNNSVPFQIQDYRYVPEQQNLPPVLETRPKRTGRLGNSLFTASLLTLTALNIADYVSTVRALQLPGLEEGNPVMQPFTKNVMLFGTVKLGMAALDYYLLKKIYKKNKALGWVLSIAANVAMSYVVSHNIQKIQAFSGR
jgi:hypothetical protein